MRKEHHHNPLSSVYLKRTFQIRDLLNQVDTTRILYPRGLITKIGKSIEKQDTVKRVELFAKKHGDTYGIIRSFHVAYSSERALLDMAQASNNVITVRSVSSSDQVSIESKRLVEDKLVLKRAEDNIEDPKGEHVMEAEPFLRPRTPDIAVSTAWLEKMKLARGSRLLVSNPLENYAVVPPSVA